MRPRDRVNRDLAASLAHRRRAVGLTQNEVALATGLTETIICRLETLRLPISPERRALIEQVLTEAEQQREAEKASPAR
jgi:predicted transcriptional regulator